MDAIATGRFHDGHCNVIPVIPAANSSVRDLLPWLFCSSASPPSRRRCQGFDNSCIKGKHGQALPFPPSLRVAAGEAMNRHHEQPPTRIGILQGGWGRARNAGKCFNHPGRRGMGRWEGKNHTRPGLRSRQRCNPKTPGSGSSQGTKHGILEYFGLEGTFKGHLAQPTRNEQSEACAASLLLLRARSLSPRL